VRGTVESYQGRFFRLVALTLIGGVCCLASACGSSSSSGGSSDGSAPVSSAPSSTTTSTPKVENLVATPAVKTALLAAGAKMHHLPASDYTGLVKGKTYYAYDPSTKIHWAGASLIAKPGDMQAEVGNQDDGAYLVYKQPSGGAWTAYPAGVTGAGSRCMVTPPAAVNAVWGWAAGSCHPRNA
jgi:hypothetical protein